MEQVLTLSIAAFVAITLVPFVLVWVLIRRGSRGGKVRSLGQRRRSGRGVDFHAATDRFDAARDANRRLAEPSGPLTRLRRWISRRRP